MHQHQLGVLVVALICIASPASSQTDTPQKIKTTIAAQKFAHAELLQDYTVKLFSSGVTLRSENGTLQEITEREQKDSISVHLVHTFDDSPGVNCITIIEKRRQGKWADLAAGSADDYSVYWATYWFLSWAGDTEAEVVLRIKPGSKYFKDRQDTGMIKTEITNSGQVVRSRYMVYDRAKNGWIVGQVTVVQSLVVTRSCHASKETTEALGNSGRLLNSFLSRVPLFGLQSLLTQ